MPFYVCREVVVLGRRFGHVSGFVDVHWPMHSARDTQTLENDHSTKNAVLRRRFRSGQGASRGLALQCVRIWSVRLLDGRRLVPVGRRVRHSSHQQQAVRPVREREVWDRKLQQLPLRLRDDRRSGYLRQLGGHKMQSVRHGQIRSRRQIWDGVLGM